MATRDESYHPSRAEGSRPRARGFRGRLNHLPRTGPAYQRTEQDLKERQVARLPCSANDFLGDRLAPAGWNPIVRSLLSGTRSDDAANVPLSLLRPFESTLVREIFSYLQHPYAHHVRLTLPADLVGNAYDRWKMTFVKGRGRKKCSKRILDQEDYAPWPPSTNNPLEGYVAFCKVDQVEFPPPNSRDVNMMPFILGDKESLPEDLQCYYPMIDACPFYQEEFGKVAYLTVQESDVGVDQTQRRPGLHIESPGVFPDTYESANEADRASCSFSPGVEHPWGMGVFFGPDRYEGGIYIASNMDESTEVWDALVDRNKPFIVDRHGECEHLRPLVGPGTKLRAGELVWMTDCTPHEALPQKTAGTRQFFRLVMPYISHWYADHSTANPNVPLPDSITVIRGNKFQTPLHPSDRTTKDGA